jgi:O-antigen ligase
MLSFLFSNFICKKNVANYFIKWLTITVSISSAIAIIQEIIYIKTGYVLAGFLKEHEYSYLLEVRAFGRTVLRTPGFVVSFKVFSFLLITNLLIIFNQYLYSQFKDIKTKLYFFTAVCLMLIALILTFSKDSMLALFIGMIFSLIVRRPNRIIHVFAGLLILGLGIYSTGLYKDIYNFMSEEIRWGEVMMRIQVNKDGIYSFINNHFWIGGGFGMGSRYTNNLYSWPPHNNIILASVEIGILGLCSYLLLIGYTVFNIFALNLTVKNNKDKALVRGLFFSIIFLFVLFQTHAGYVDNILWMYMGIIQGVVLLLGAHPSVNKEIEGMKETEFRNP